MKEPIRIGILETGTVNPHLRDKYGSYDEMFYTLLKRANINSTYRLVKVANGERPKTISDADLWLITGSRHAVYETLSWIKPLIQFIQDCFDSKTPILGVCFGHQILAKAMGGKVGKHTQGWGVGVQNYKMIKRPIWSYKIGESFNTYTMHQDQVVEIPKTATVLASSSFCLNAMISYGDPDKPIALSIQSHPEFSSNYTRDLILARKGNTIPEKVADQAIKTLQKKVDNTVLIKSLISALKNST